MAEEAASESADAAAPSTPSDPYVIYQLRKPSQRGTAVIPRFVPNTHAPAFSPANYRFARVWATDPANAAAASLLHVPRSFEYAGSLGSESSFWSDTSSWVSVSSLRTAHSDARAPLLHGPTAPVSAAAFFNDDFDSTRRRPALRSPSTRSSDLDSPARRDFRYPPALSESITEDAVIDDLLAMRPPDTRHAPSPLAASATAAGAAARRSASPAAAAAAGSRAPTPRPQPHPGPVNSRPVNAAATAAAATHSAPRAAAPSLKPAGRPAFTRAAPPAGERHGFLPALTRKRRSLWQWLFCSDNAAGSTTVASVREAPGRSKPRVPEGAARSLAQANTAAETPRSKGQQDRVPREDRDFLQRAHRAADAHTSGGGNGRRRSGSRRMPSFELRRGRPNENGQTRRSLSWSLMPKAFLNKDSAKKKKKAAAAESAAAQAAQEAAAAAAAASKKKKKRKSKQKDRPRGLVGGEDSPEESRTYRAAFQKTLLRREQGPTTARNRGSAEPRIARGTDHANQVLRRELSQDRPREDRRRADRPRQYTQGQAEPPLAAPMQASVVPSLREKKGGSGSLRSQRMRSGESCDPVTSRISSDLSSSVERTTRSTSGHSTPVELRDKYRSGVLDIDPASHGVSSDVSSHVSGLGKVSPVIEKADPDPTVGHIPTSSSIEYDNVNVARSARRSPLRSDLFAFPSSSSDSSAFMDSHPRQDWISNPASYPEYGKTPVHNGSDGTHDSAAVLDPVARALEKNKARSAGGPLSYLMKHHDSEHDVNTQSTGLTSLADESVSTHKTISAIGDDYRGGAGGFGLSRYQYRESRKASKAGQDVLNNDVSESSAPSRPIFKNSALFSRTSGTSPSHGSSASPRRFHSDWSDPHATDIEVYCQCSCSCVYEEECRRTCELIFGRSPSVSSTRSGSRRGYPGFQTLPPTMAAVGARNYILNPDATDNGDSPFALMGDYSHGAPADYEPGGHTQRSLNRASVLDKLPDPRMLAGEHAPSGSTSTGHSRHRASEVSSNGAREYAHGGSRHSGQASSWDLENRSADRPREESSHESRRRHQGRASHSGQGPGGVSRDTRTTDSRAHSRDSSRSSKHAESSPRLDVSSQRERGTRPREERHRSSFRNATGAGVSARPPPSGTRREEKSRGNGRDGEYDGGFTERRRKDEGSRKKQSSRAEALGSRQMGNSYVVRRDGLPPFGQSSIPQPYRASVYGREASYDYEEEAAYDERVPIAYGPAANATIPAGYGPPPIVEAEFESIGATNPRSHVISAVRSLEPGYQTLGQGGGSARPETRKPAKEAPHQSGRKPSNGQHQHQHLHALKGEARSSAKHAKPSTRSTSKNAARSRAPLFGIF